MQALGTPRLCLSSSTKYKHQASCLSQSPSFGLSSPFLLSSFVRPNSVIRMSGELPGRQPLGRTV